MIGWSLGGVFARELARRAPALVRQVTTLGSPFANEPKANAWRLYEALSGRQVGDWPGREAMKLPPPVPSTAIYTRTDGIAKRAFYYGCVLQTPTPRLIGWSVGHDFISTEAFVWLDWAWHHGICQKPRAAQLHPLHRVLRWRLSGFVVLGHSIHPQLRYPLACRQPEG